MTTWLVLGTGWLWAADAHANERRFTYTYDTAVLPQGIREVEVWTTLRPTEGALRIDNRVEIEVPITNRLLTALYLNGSSSLGGFEGGVSNEWKLQVVNAALHPVGLALYGEVGLSPAETELEAKVLVDHRTDAWILAYNLVGEHEWERELTDDGTIETGRDLKFENDLGIAFRATPTISLGVEARNHNIFSADTGFEHATFFAGPTIGFTSPDFWVAATAFPQLGAFIKQDDGATTWGRESHDHEAFNARVLVGVNF